MESILILCSAVLLDWIFGDPIKIPHPIGFIGKGIHWLEKGIRKSGLSLKLGGLFLLILSTGSVVGFITALLYVANSINPWLRIFVTIYLLYTSLAAKCLRVEGMKVFNALKAGNLSEGRRFVSYLVGRDTQNLDEDEVIRAAVETAAENTVDGVLAPLFYMVIGLVFDFPVQAVFLYKTINTLDSMVGYIQEPYREIGFFSAKTDDVFNYIPARIGSLFMLVGGAVLRYDLKNGIRILVRDRRNHKSPNSGYPESTVAGLLGIQMGGTNRYFNETMVKPTIGDADRPIDFKDIPATLRIMYASQGVMLLICLALLIAL
jgi:adenosylcobinamide-phosphate synthase